MFHPSSTMYLKWVRFFLWLLWVLDWDFGPRDALGFANVMCDFSNNPWFFFGPVMLLL